MSAAPSELSVVPELSVVVAWRDRSDIARALRQNAATLNGCRAEVVIVNAGGDRDDLHSLVQDCGCRTLRLIEMPGLHTFNKSECLNVGCHVSRGVSLLMLDADVIVDDTFVVPAMEAVKRGGCFVSLRQVIESNPDVRPETWRKGSYIRERVMTTEITCADGKYASFEYRESSDGRRSGPGIVVVRRQDFTAVQGFNAQFEGWGYEDFDLQVRLQLALGLKRLTFGEAAHLSHPLAPSYAHTSARNLALGGDNYNRSELRGTLSADVVRWGRRIIEAPALGRMRVTLP